MKILAITSRSVTLELDSASPYYSLEEYAVSVNGKYLRSEQRNVFSVFGLEPETDYAVTAGNEEVTVKTLSESCITDIKSFGAKGDGVHDDTAAFLAAVNCLPPRSTLYISGGNYFLRPVFLASEITVYLDKEAVITADPDRSHYPVLPANIGGRNLGTWQGEEADCFASVFYSYGTRGVSIVGEGVIDCNALNGDWYVDHRKRRGAWRPRGLFFNRCEDLLLQGITVKNTPSWNIHPYFCKRVNLLDLTLENPPEMPTTDGIDPDCCDGVNIFGVKISVGDDCIAIKSGTLEFANKYATACKNINIRNCLMLKGHGGVVLGSELSGGVNNVSVSQCVFDGTDRGLRIKTRRGRGRIGGCGGVTFSDIVMRGVKVPFVINMFYNMGDGNGHCKYVWTTEKLPVDELTPELGSFTFKNMVCAGVEYCAAAVYGLPEAPVESVAFENVRFSYNTECSAGFPDMREYDTAVKNGGLIFSCVKEVSLKNVTFDGLSGDAVKCENVENFDISD